MYMLIMKKATEIMNKLNDVKEVRVVETAVETHLFIYFYNDNKRNKYCYNYALDRFELVNETDMAERKRK